MVQKKCTLDGFRCLPELQGECGFWFGFVLVFFSEFVNRADNQPERESSNCWGTCQQSKEKEGESVQSNTGLGLKSRKPPPLLCGVTGVTTGFLCSLLQPKLI